jgi:sugar lactone lactonase YvrE
VQKLAISPGVWRPPTATKRARQRNSDRAFEIQLIDLPGLGPEDVTLDEQGRMITGVSDGRILRIETTGTVEQIADTGGHPLGVEIGPGGDLIVCDCHRGLMRVGVGDGSVEVLVDEFAGERLIFCNNATVAKDGTIYFTDSSKHFNQEAYRGEQFEHSETGRLFRRSPDGMVEVLGSGFSFANGVTLSLDEDYVLVAETGSYRIQRVWVSGPLTGRREIFVDNLPGFPDNLSTGATGLFWVALPNARNRILDFLLPRAPILRKIIWRIPEVLQPRERSTVWVQAYDANGQLVHDLQTSHPRFGMVTGVRESGGTIFLGSLSSHAVAFARL